MAKRKKTKIFRTPEERAAWQARHDALTRELQNRIDRIKAELVAKGQWDESRDLDFYLRRARAELAAKGQVPPFFASES